MYISREKPADLPDRFLQVLGKLHILEDPAAVRILTANRCLKIMGALWCVHLKGAVLAFHFCQTVRVSRVAGLAVKEVC